MPELRPIPNTQLVTAAVPDWCEALNESLHLPLIQRNFVWKPEQIAFLWDIILRGFPLGTLMVVPIDSQIIVKSNANYQHVKHGWLLLDGQQRSRAIKGGYDFSEQNGFRVWVGLDLDTRSPNPKLLFDIRVTTQQQPFGFDPFFKPLSMKNRMSAYKKLEEQMKRSNATGFGLDVTKPFGNGSTQYFPIDAYFDNTLSKYEVDPEKIPSPLKEALESVRHYQIVALSVDSKVLYGNHEPLATTDDPETEDINLPVELLFERVGSGGTSLSNEDYAYSLIKQRMPGAHNVVERALEDPRVGGLFSPLSIISIALRLSCSFSEEGSLTSDAIHYSKKAIFKIIENRFNRSFIETQVVETNRLTEVIKCLISNVLYQVSENRDGLPISLLKTLPISYWQLLVCWYWKHPASASHEYQQSKELIAFTLLWLLYSPNTKIAAKLTGNCIKKIRSNSELSVDWLSEQLCLHCGIETKEGLPTRTGMFSPTLLQKSFVLSQQRHNPILMNKQSRILTLSNLFSDESLGLAAGDCLSHFWHNKKLLLWFQRHYLAQINEQTKVRISSHITPFDYDHIVPQNFWAKGSTSRGRRLLEEPYFYDSSSQRNAHIHLGNSIGNYQLLSFVDNRTKQDIDYQGFIDRFSGSLADDLCIDE